MIRLLSTKVLTPAQKKIVESDRIQLTEYNAIRIDFQAFDLDNIPDYYIFTSQNAVAGFMAGLPQGAEKKGVFCVGQKTSALAGSFGFPLLKTAENSVELGNYIAENYRDKFFIYVCGNRRRQDLPDILNKNTVRYQEVITYKTSLNRGPEQVSFDGVLFFSPSGVESYTSANTTNGYTAFCIGETTAGVAARHTQKVVVSPDQSIEGVLRAASVYFSSAKAQENYE